MTGKRNIRYWHRVFFLTMVALLSAAAYAGDPDRPETILVLHSYNREYRWTEDINSGIMQVLDAMTEPHLVCVEYLDWKRFPDPSNIEKLKELWRDKYANVPIDVIITSDDKALEFAANNRKALFSDAPVVYTGVYPESIKKLTGGRDRITGVFEEQDIRTTVGIALKIQKDPRAAYIVSDLNESGSALERHIKDTIQEMDGSIPVGSLSNLPVGEIEKFVSGLTKRDLLFIGSYSIDANGRTFAGEELIGRVGRASKTPLYVLNAHHLGTGAFGGNLLSPLLLGVNSGKLAVKILKGTPANRIPPLSASSFTPMFDWNAMRRYGIPRSVLPRNAVIINRDIPFTERYWKELTWIAVVMAILLVALNVTFVLYRKARFLARDLAGRNEEITLLNESLSQSEEELRQQYNEITIIKENLEESEERYRLSSIGSNDALWDWRYTTDKVHYSGRWYEMTGYDPIKGANIQIADILHPDDRGLFDAAFRNHVQGKTEHFRCEARIRTATGDYKWVLLRGKVIRDERIEGTRFAGSITDIDDRKHKEAEIENLAFFDQLTKLPNKTRAIEQTRLALETAGGDTRFGLMFIDLDNFKFINDMFGHPVGDQVLLQSARELSSLVGENIHLSRFGSDEFTLFVENATGEQMEKYGKLALRLLGRKMDISGRSHFLTASAGIALYPDHAENFGELFKNADAALHRAKADGKKRFLMFNAAIQQELVDRMELENALRTAIENGELWVAYQPLISLGTKKIAGFEALARWSNPRLGLISPEQFIPVAEEAGLIEDIGLFVLESAARFIQRAVEANQREFRVSVNVSVKQLHDKDFVRSIIAILKTHNVGPDRIALEITESFLIEDLDPVYACLTELREAGFRLSLDDFGKGYSSLSYLRTLPLDYIKIDKTFIDDILACGSAVPLAKTIITISHQLGLEVVAEGVEVKEQLDYLKEHGCDYIQGFYYSKPDTEARAIDQLELSFD